MPNAKSTIFILETIPTELLHEIFIYSANVNLALTTLPLARKLSSPHLYLPICRIAFPSPWDIVCGSSTHIEHFRAGASRSALFRCRWMTYDFFKHFMDTEMAEWKQKIMTWKGWDGRHASKHQRHFRQEYKGEIWWEGGLGMPRFLDGTSIPAKMFWSPWTKKQKKWQAWLKGLGAVVDQDDEDTFPLILDELSSALLRKSSNADWMICEALNIDSNLTREILQQKQFPNAVLDLLDLRGSVGHRSLDWESTDVHEFIASKCAMRDKRGDRRKLWQWLEAKKERQREERQRYWREQYFTAEERLFQDGTLDIRGWGPQVIHDLHQGRISLIRTAESDKEELCIISTVDWAWF